MWITCDLCGESWDYEDSCNCPNCGSFSTRPVEDE